MNTYSDKISDSPAFKKQLLLSIILFVVGFSTAQTTDSLQLRRLYDYYLSQSKCYSNLEYLCKKIGGRISGSAQAEQAVQWAKQAMYGAGADTVILQPCMVPRWVRGKKEVCNYSTQGKLKTVSCVALGSSVGTGAKGLKAKVVEVKSFEELERLGEKEVKGSIVFYNVFLNRNTSEQDKHTEKQ